MTLDAYFAAVLMEVGRYEPGTNVNSYRLQVIKTMNKLGDLKPDMPTSSLDFLAWCGVDYGYRSV